MGLDLHAYQNQIVNKFYFNKEKRKRFDLEKNQTSIQLFYTIPYVRNANSYDSGRSRQRPPPSRVNQKLPSAYTSPNT